ncbi:MAG: peroxiredoxin [Labilithrix sp.]|nr:peroxiredoxin [Labilithrix sp.]MCW5816200.1 peroxiredoxin [Labilithrix sp.]
MTIKIGDKLPDATLYESTSFGEFCPNGPEPVSVADATKGKRIVIFALPGAFTPTCSAQHVPGYLKHHDAIKAKKVDEIWCVSVNDGFVMAAWGQAEKGIGKIRFLGDGDGDFTKKVGLELDLVGKGLGLRSQRYSMLVDDGVVKQLNVESGKFEVSSAEKMLEQLG